MRSAPLAELALIGIAAVWGATFVLVQDAIREIPVMTFLAYRFLPAALVVAPIFRRELRELTPAGWRAGLLMGVLLTVGYVFQTFGLERTTASNAGFITGLFVVLTPLFGSLFLGQRVSRLAWLAAAVAAVGLFLLSGAGGGAHLAGDVLVLLCACAFALHILATGRAAGHHAPGGLVTVQLALCGLVSLVVAAVAGDLEVPRGRVVWTALAITSLVASALGFFVQTYAQRRTPAARTALLLASEPVFAGIFAYVLLGERLSAWGWTGAALILGAIAVVEGTAYAKSVRSTSA